MRRRPRGGAGDGCRVGRLRQNAVVRATVAAFGCLVSAGRERNGIAITAVDASTGEPVKARPPQRSRPGGRRRRQLCQRLRCPSLRHRRPPIHRRRLPTIQRECGSGIRIRARCWCSPHLVADHGRCWTGACILQHRSTSCAPRRRDSRIRPPDSDSPGLRQQSDGSVDASARRSSRLRPAAPLPSSSPNFGADAGAAGLPGRRDRRVRLRCRRARWVRVSLALVDDARGGWDIRRKHDGFS